MVDQRGTFVCIWKDIIFWSFIQSILLFWHKSSHAVMDNCDWYLSKGLVLTPDRWVKWEPAPRCYPFYTPCGRNRHVNIALCLIVKLYLTQWWNVDEFLLVELIYQRVVRLHAVNQVVPVPWVQGRQVVRLLERCEKNSKAFLLEIIFIIIIFINFLKLFSDSGPGGLLYIRIFIELHSYATPG